MEETVLHTDPAPRGNGVRALLMAPAFMRLWAIGFCVNAMRWFEVLAAALFTLDVTGSGFAVALVTAARTMPMLLLGAFAGVMAESVNRKHVLVIGQLMTAATSATIAILAGLGLVQPWHLAAAALVAGTVWSTEMATRRRMVGESVGGRLVPRALAFDTVTNSVCRMAGPVTAGALYQFVGLAGAFAVSAAMYLLAALLASGLRYRQVRQSLVLAHVPRNLAEGLVFARGHVVIAGVLLVTMTMNFLGFSYSALIAPIGRQHFMVSPILVGVLAGAEAFGALLGGVCLASGDPPGSGRVLMVGGSMLFLICVALMPFAPGFLVAFVLLTVGGIGSAAFSNMQTSLIVIHAPPFVRSRLLGLLTVSIGTAPLGVLLIGVIARQLGPLVAVDVMALSGLVVICSVGLLWRRNERSAALVPRLERVE